MSHFAPLTFPASPTIRTSTEHIPLSAHTTVARPPTYKQPFPQTSVSCHSLDVESFAPELDSSMEGADVDADLMWSDTVVPTSNEQRNPRTSELDVVSALKPTEDDGGADGSSNTYPCILPSPMEDNSLLMSALDAIASTFSTTQHHELLGALATIPQPLPAAAAAPSSLLETAAQVAQSAVLNLAPNPCGSDPAGLAPMVVPMRRAPSPTIKRVRRVENIGSPSGTMAVERRAPSVAVRVAQRASSWPEQLIPKAVAAHLDRGGAHLHTYAPQVPRQTETVAAFAPYHQLQLPPHHGCHSHPLTPTHVGNLVFFDKESAAYKNEDGTWSTKLTDLHTTELNAFFKRSSFTSNEITDLKRVRRQRRNQIYTKAARDRRLAKELEGSSSE